MGFESYKEPVPEEPAPQETSAEKNRAELAELDKQLEELNTRIEAKKKGWRKAEERNYEFRMNFSADTEGKPVDFIRLNKRDRSEQIKYDAYRDGERITERQMENIQAEIDELEKQKSDLLSKKNKLD